MIGFHSVYKEKKSETLAITTRISEMAEGGGGGQFPSNFGMWTPLCDHGAMIHQLLGSWATQHTTMCLDH